MSLYDVRIPGLKMTVVQADGRYVEPVEIDEFRFAVAETYDVIVTPAADKAYTIAAESIDRTGFALGTLAPQQGMKGPAPEKRPRSLLTMVDMGHDIDHGSSEMQHDDMEMDHSGHDMSESDKSAMQSGWADAGTPEGHKALQYSDLRSLDKQTDLRPAEREIEVELGGNMERFIWTINGRKFSDPDFQPIQLRYGERVRLVFKNTTMMAHPMHLHGMFVQLENGQPAAKLPDKHTVNVPPGDSYSVLLTANEAGEWAFHCHLLYHMAAGMMSKVVVAEYNDELAAAPATSDKEMGGHHGHH